MPYEVLVEKIKTLPEQYLNEVSDFVEYITLKANHEQKKNGNVTERINKLCNSIKDENWKPVMNSGIESARELLKNDTW